MQFLRATKEFGLAHNMSPSKAFEKYCGMASLEVDDQKFCYNTEPLRRDIFRLLDLGADEQRVCRKIRAVNPDFCPSRSSASSSVRKPAPTATAAAAVDVDVTGGGTSEAAPAPQRGGRRGVIYI